MEETASVLRWLLAFVWAPVLVAAGTLDWAVHRALGIEHTAGWRESALHLAMLAVVGGAIVAALALVPTAGLLALLLALLVLHELLYLADLRVALASRRIPLVEQWVHGFQHLLPWAGLGALLALAPDQALALAQLPGHVADWSLRRGAGVAPPAYALALVGAALLLNVLPFGEECWRAARVVAQRRREGRGPR